MSSTRRILGLVLTSLALLAAACSGGVSGDVQFSGDPKPDPTPKNIVEVLQADGRFTTLLAAAGEASGVADALAGPGPVTLFAPTDEAFAAADLDIDALKGLGDQLPTVLAYHAVGQQLAAGDVLAADSLSTLAGIDLAVDAGGPSVGGASIIETDVAAPNGVIHVISGVLVPES